ncbi:MAG TPA: response regulator [Azospirillum sp.]|nr:response regulator [Azospirillum sp.]
MIIHSLNSKIIIAIDDDQSCLNSYKLFIQTIGLTAITFDSCNDAISFMELSQEPVLCVLLDLHLKRGLSGQESIDTLRKLNRDLPIIIITGDTSPAAKSLTRVTGQPVLIKPFPPKGITDVIDAIRRG